MEVNFPTMNLLDSLSDEDLEMLNDLLPWSCFTLDSNGRQFGKPYSKEKRGTAQPNVDYRITELARRIDLFSKVVLEVGCYEGVHTAALAERSQQVKAFDGRVEHVVKTIVRCAMLGLPVNAFVLDLEKKMPENIDLSCDIIHHVGVLYHLENPVEHLHTLAPFCTETIMLDTHVASPNKTCQTLEYKDHKYKYWKQQDGGRALPFAGMGTHAKWLTEASLCDALMSCGFEDIDIAERRNERNGSRVLIYANKARKF